MNENELSEKIIGFAMKIHTALGPGLLESAYEKAFVYELSRNGLSVEQQKMIPIEYDGLAIDEGFRADLVVNDMLIIELKSVKSIDDVHLKQLLTYLRLSKIKLGLIINFNVASLKHGIKRVINGTI